ncbi:hypothetical protein FHS82_003735 [Pseudochelatococcus lubricantis]|uniref:Uncharacterized protein n=1 Tax=Pseudochelatococcus lubricantis TaxID=1538102 RepID=A0ABX0V703_9HYPH|nr:hypothetical protein [Pseudochelatococcus lubricantis]NIJ59874.1 hypothetical protein [Pseudochelatococcus lubricantis]
MTSRDLIFPTATETAQNARQKREAEQERLRRFRASGDISVARAELVESLLLPDDFKVDEAVRHVAILIRSASERGLIETLVYRFPSEVLADRGRAIIAGDADWPDSLRGQPLVMYNLWREHLKPLGYGLRIEILDYRNDLPGDVGAFMFWGAGDS